MASKLLAYNINIMKMEKLKKLCEDLNIEIICVSPEEYDFSIGYLAQISGIEKVGETTSGGTVKEMIVFCGLTSEDLDLFLERYKSMAIPPINLKAMVTPTNINWSGKKLYAELELEHSQMHKK